MRGVPERGDRLEGRLGHQPGHLVPVPLHDHLALLEARLDRAELLIGR